MTQESKVPLCEMIAERLIAKSDPFRDSETAGMMHISVALEIVRDGFAALTVEDVARVVAGYEPLMWKYMSALQKREYLDKAQAVMKLLRKE